MSRLRYQRALSSQNNTGLNKNRKVYTPKASPNRALSSNLDTLKKPEIISNKVIPKVIAPLKLDNLPKFQA